MASNEGAADASQGFLDDDGGVRGMDAEDYGAAKKSWLRQEEGRFAEGARRDSVAGKTLKNIGKTVLDAAMSAVGKVVGPVGAAIGKSDRQIAGEAIERQKAQTTDMGALDAERAPFYQKHWKDLGFSEAPAEDLRGDDLTHWVTWQKFNQTQQRKRDAKISDGWEFERYETPKEGARWLEPEKYEDPATGETRWRGRETTVTSVGRMTFPDGKGGFGESEVVRDEKGRHVFMDADGVKRDADTLKVIGEPDGFWKDFGWRNPTVQTFMMKLARSPQAYAQYKERLLDEADMYLAKLESGEKIGAGEKGAEFASNIEDLLPLAGAAKEIGKQISIAQIATALSKDPESVSPMMKAWVMRELAKAERERVNGTTTAAAIEEGVAALIPFAAELGLGKAAIDKLTNLKTLAKGKLLDPNASALAKYLYSSAYGASVLGAQEIITAPRVVAGALERINRDYVSRIDDRGRLVLERSGEGQGVGEAWGNAFLDTLVENVSEMSGEAMGVVAKPFAQYLAKKKAGAALVRAIRAVEKATRPGSIAGAGRNEVIGGLVSEGMEERVGGFMRGFLGVDITDAEKAEGSGAARSRRCRHRLTTRLWKRRRSSRRRCLARWGTASGVPARYGSSGRRRSASGKVLGAPRWRPALRCLRRRVVTADSRRVRPRWRRWSRVPERATRRRWRGARPPRGRWSSRCSRRSTVVRPSLPRRASTLRRWTKRRCSGRWRSASRTPRGRRATFTTCFRPPLGRGRRMPLRALPRRPLRPL